jgi:hypothetical protein
MKGEYTVKREALAPTTTAAMMHNAVTVGTAASRCRCLDGERVLSSREVPH